MESIDTSAVIGNGICIHYSLPTESLFLTINTEPNVYKSFCYTNVEINQNPDDPEKTLGIAKNGVWLKPMVPKGSTPSQTPTSSESSKGTKSKKYRGALKTSTSTSESSDSGSEKKLNYMRNFTDVNGHPGIVTANYGSNIAIITSQRTQASFQFDCTISSEFEQPRKLSTYLKTNIRSISRFYMIKDLSLIWLVHVTISVTRQKFKHLFWQ